MIVVVVWSSFEIVFWVGMGKAIVPCPVYLHDVARLVIHVHSGFGFVDIVGVMLVELGGLIRQFAAGAALRIVLLPQKAQCNTAFLHLLVDVLVVRHGSPT